MKKSMVWMHLLWALVVVVAFCSGRLMVQRDVTAGTMESKKSVSFSGHEGMSDAEKFNFFMGFSRRL